jgi:hypothetical protein
VARTALKKPDPHQHAAGDAIRRLVLELDPVLLSLMVNTLATRTRPSGRVAP